MLFSIIVKDLSQVMMTCPIEDKMKSHDVTGKIFQTTLMNLIFAIFDTFLEIFRAYNLEILPYSQLENIWKTIRIRDLGLETEPVLLKIQHSGQFAVKKL